jgi:hypothetical protein
MRERGVALCPTLAAADGAEAPPGPEHCYALRSVVDLRPDRVCGIMFEPYRPLDSTDPETGLSYREQLDRWAEWTGFVWDDAGRKYAIHYPGHPDLEVIYVTRPGDVGPELELSAADQDYRKDLLGIAAGLTDF